MNSFGGITALLLLIFAAAPAYSADAQLSNVISCMKLAAAVPGNLLNGRTLAGIVGYGWDDLESVITKPVFTEEFATCQAEPTGAFLLPDYVIATPILQTSLDRMAEYYSSFDDYKQTITNTFAASAGGGYGMFSASGSFSKKHQESKEKFVKYQSSMLNTQLIYKSFNLYRDPIGDLEPGFISRIEEISNAFSQNLTDRARYLAEKVVRDFGTHYVSTADTGAIIEQQTYIDSMHQYDDTTTLDDVRASAGASFGSYFHAKADDTHDVTTENKQTLSKITKHTQLTTNGGPDVNAVLGMVNNGSMQINNLVSFNHDGDWLYNLVLSRNFPNIDPSLIFPTQELLKNATELYYNVTKYISCTFIIHYNNKNTIYGCTDPNAPNYNFQANVDDGNCQPNNDSYPFGGVFQTCTPLDGSPSWRCDNLTQDNTWVGSPSCEKDLFEPVLLLQEVYHFEDRIVNEPKKECHRHWFSKKCHWVDYYITYKDSAQVSAYWCRKRADVPEVPPKQGAMFGGLFEAGHQNDYTSSIGCPGGYESYHFGRGVTVCLSYQYEQDHQYSVPVEKFFSCQTPAKEKTCSPGFTQRLGATENNCDWYYCVKKQVYKQRQHPNLKRPPFTPQQLAASNFSEHTLRAVYKGAELFSEPLKLFGNDSNTRDAQFDLKAILDEVHEKVLIVSNNLTATAAETLENIKQVDPDY